MNFCMMFGSLFGFSDDVWCVRPSENNMGDFFIDFFRQQTDGITLPIGITAAVIIMPIAADAVFQLLPIKRVVSEKTCQSRSVVSEKYGNVKLYRQNIFAEQLCGKRQDERRLSGGEQRFEMPFANMTVMMAGVQTVCHQLPNLVPCRMKNNILSADETDCLAV